MIAKLVVSLVVGFALVVSAEVIPPVRLEVDASAAPKNLLHSHLYLPVNPGPLTLFYPKWIPGEHSPSGPVNNMTGLKFFANGQVLPWQRDPEDLFAFRLTIPPGISELEVVFDFLASAGGGEYSSGNSSSAHLLDLNWNQLLLYPTNGASLQTPFAARLQLPAGWQFATALPLQGTNGATVSFAPVSLESLIDSPVICGQYFRSFDLNPGARPPYSLAVVADAAADLEVTPEDRTNCLRLTREAAALFGAHHFPAYHFLVTVSDHVDHFGLEHHASSDDRFAHDFWTSEAVRRLGAEVLPHELVHSWNGKYRRPAGLATPDYQQPMHDELLWVYEGLTEYYGKVLATRCGLQTNEDFYGEIAYEAALQDHRFGREWRSLADVSVAGSLLYEAPGVGNNRRRSIDFYSEGDLIWLEVDTLIRQRTHGKKSLDDFCRRFHGGQNSTPQVVPYTAAEVYRTLNEVATNDWAAFFQQRVYSITPRAPLGGITNGGWHLVYTNELPEYLKAREEQHKYTDATYSLGFALSEDGGVGEVLPGTPADQAGLYQGLKLIAVNGHKWTAAILRAALKTAVTNQAPLELLTLNDDFYQTYQVNYHDGERYPVLVQDPDHENWLDAIIAPKARGK